MRDAFFVIRKAKAPEEADTFSEIFSNKEYWIEMYCPDCKEVHHGQESYEKHSEYNYDVLKGITCSNCNTLFGADRVLRLYYKHLNMEHLDTNIYDNGDKIAISSFFNIYDIFRSRLVVRNINARFVLNIRTGQSYFLSPIDTKTKKPFMGYVSGTKTKYAKIRNITMGYTPMFFRCIPDEIKDEIENVVYDKIEDYYGFKVHPDKRDGKDDIFASNRFPRLSHHTMNSIFSNFLISNNTGGFNAHRFLSKIKPYHDDEDFSRIMLKSFNIPHKRKLIRIVTEDWSQAVNYHHVRTWGIKNYDNILNVLENLSYRRYNLEDISGVIHVKNFKEKHYTKETYFIRKMLELNSERKIVNMIRKDAGLFFDAARMYHDIISYDKDPEVKNMIADDNLYKKKIKVIHDNIMHVHIELRNKNIPIEYNDEQESLQDNIDNLEFFLPRDTNQLKHIGLKMHHCVGSYADMVLRKEVTIVGVKDKKDYQVCIEVDKGLKNIRQAKAHYNHCIKGDIAKAVSKWLKKHNLNDKSRDILLNNRG